MQKKVGMAVCGEKELIPPFKVTYCKGCPIYYVSYNSKLETIKNH